MTGYHLTGADEQTTMLITFPTTTPSNLPNLKSTAVAMTSLRVATDPDQRNSARPAIRIQGTKGEIQVDGPAFRPQRYRIIPRRDQASDHLTIREVDCPFPNNGHGMYWEADEAARCVRDGKLESEGLPWEESIIIMEVMDEARRQGGLTYPEKIESTAYPLQL
jgi:predicted dehydrogenase